MAALVALMGCSDDLPSTTGGAEQAPPVIRVADGGGATKAGDTAALGAPEAMSSEPAGDARMMPMPCGGVTEFELVGELPSLDTPADGWRYSMITDLDPAVVERVKAVFGLEGDVVALNPEWGGGWRLGPDDGTAPAVWFGLDPMGWWSYSAPWATTKDVTAISSDIAVAPSGEVVGDGQMPLPVEPVPPVGVPDAAQAEQLARQLFADLGLEVNDADMEVYADQWGASVTLFQVLNGMRTGMGTSVGFGANASLSYAGGQWNTPEPVAGFERVGTQAAFERLSSTGGGWWGGPTAKIMLDCAPMMMPGDPAAAEGDAMVQPAVFTVRIVDVKESWWTLYDVDGAMWLVPGYTFVDSDGGEHLVPAVSDDLIQPVEPAPIDEPVVSEPVPDTPTPVTAVPGDTGASEPGYDPDRPVTSPAASDVVERLVGLPEDEAVTVAKELGFEMRITERDGEQFAVTADYRTDRVNVVIAAGVVTSASIG